MSVCHKYKGVHYFCPKLLMFVVYHKTMRKFCVANSLCFKDSEEWNTNYEGESAKAKLRVETCKTPFSTICKLAF